MHQFLMDKLMDRNRFNRRDLLLWTSGVIGTALVIGPFQIAAQGQVRPSPPTNLTVEIMDEDYEKWLKIMREAAEQLAGEDEVELDEEVAKEFDAKVRETLSEKGIKIVRPLPPTNLTAE